MNMQVNDRQAAKSAKNQSAKTPQLRFPEFSGDWVEKRLEHGITLISGQHLSPTEYNTNSIGIPYFTGPSDFTNDKARCTKWTTASGHTGKKEDVLITVKGNGVGKLLFCELDEVAMGRQLMAIRSKGYSTQFVFCTLLIRDRLFQSLAAGNLIPGLSRKDILHAKVALPSLPEQKKIAGFLSTVDRRIEALEKKRDLLKEYKKGLMQKLFNQTLRFSDNLGNPFPDWEEKKLGEVGIFISGVGFPEKEQGGEIGTPFFKVSDMNNSGNETHMLRANHYVNDGQIVRLKFKPIRKRSIIFAKVGAAIFLERKRIAEDFLIDNNMMAFIPDGLIEFFKHLFSTIRLAKYAQVGALPSYNASDLRTIKIQLPSLAEQRKIADCLSAVDRKIEAVGLQVDQSRAFKQGLLQQLFV